VKGTVSVATGAAAMEMPLPARLQEALGELVGAAREGLLALSVGVGRGVLAEVDRTLDRVQVHAGSIGGSGRLLR
jgi:hypothetical protein